MIEDILGRKSIKTVIVSSQGWYFVEISIQEDQTGGFVTFGFEDFACVAPEVGNSRVYCSALLGTQQPDGAEHVLGSKRRTLLGCFFIGQ